MLSRLQSRPLRFRQTIQNHARPRRTLTAAPGPNSGPFLERRSDRELPSLASSNRWLRTLPIFAAIMVGSALAIFNYQKSNSSVVSSTMYALRTSPQAREILGDEIYFASQLPWISGEMNQLHGVIDISFWVKGTRGKGKMSCALDLQELKSVLDRCVHPKALARMAHAAMEYMRQWSKRTPDLSGFNIARRDTYFSMPRTRRPERLDADMGVPR
nr:cytochrome c oxidase assembly factor 1 [Quercus suber]